LLDLFLNCGHRRRRERLPPKQVLWYRCSRHRRRNCLTLVFRFDHAAHVRDEEYFFALSYPYSYTRLQRYLHALDAQRLPHLRRELLCRTTQQRRLDLLKISAPHNFEAAQRKVQQL
jgi:hypothetical protein